MNLAVLCVVGVYSSEPVLTFFMFYLCANTLKNKKMFILRNTPSLCAWGDNHTSNVRLDESKVKMVPCHIVPTATVSMTSTMSTPPAPTVDTRSKMGLDKIGEWSLKQLFK